MSNPHIVLPAPLRGTPVDAVPEFQQWDPAGDANLPRNAGAELYVPPIEAAPPMLPSVDDRLKPKEFDPHGIKPFWNTAAADLPAQDLGFTAHAVLVDNYSPDWLFFPDARTWVPPFIWHAVLGLQGTQVASWQRMSPVGAIQPVSTAPITTTWYEAPLAPSTGAAVSLESGQHSTTTFQVVTVATAGQLVLPANPARYSAYFVDVGANAITLGKNAAPVVGSGILLAANGGPFNDTSTTDAWYATAATAATNMLVMEVE